MATDWVAILGEQAELAAAKAAELHLQKQTSAPTDARAVLLYQEVAHASAAFHQIVNDMQRCEVEADLHAAAARLSVAWRSLFFHAANWARELRGLPPLSERG